MVVAVAALVSAGVAVLLHGRTAPAAALPPGADTPSGVAALVERVAQLERRLDELPAATQAPLPATAETVRREDTADLLIALQSVETRVAQLERQSQPAQAQPARAAAPPRDPAIVAAELLAEIARRQNDVLDARSSAEVKLEAWRWMRREKGSWNDAVVAQMVDLGLTSTDPKVRADVWRQADGNQVHQALVPALLRALQSDGDANVREEAAETLENYFDRPEVQQALEHSSRNDLDPRVRRQASQTIASARDPRR
jgi:hypothetical protein